MDGEKRKRVFGFIIAVVFLLGIFADVVMAQDDRFPSRPIRLIIGAGPGSSTDLPMRALARAAEKILGQSIVCLNNPGGGGVRGLSTVVGEKPDGYTLGTMSVSTLINARMEKIQFAIPKDFTPVLQTYVYARAFFVRKDAPWKSWQDLMKDAREQKTGVTVGTWGPRDFGWLMLTEIEKKENVKFVFAPFSGPGEVMSALLGGHVSASTLTSGWLYVRSGECRALLVFTGRRIQSAPDVPCSKELYGLEREVFGGILAPKGLPEPILMKLHNAFKKATEDSEYRKICEKLESIVSTKSPDEFRKALEEADEATRKALLK